MGHSLTLIYLFFQCLLEALQFKANLRPYSCGAFIPSDQDPLSRLGVSRPNPTPTLPLRPDRDVQGLSTVPPCVWVARPKTHRKFLGKSIPLVNVYTHIVRPILNRLIIFFALFFSIVNHQVKSQPGYWYGFPTGIVEVQAHGGKFLRGGLGLRARSHYFHT